MYAILKIRIRPRLEPGSDYHGLVLVAGLEPARDCSRGILSPLRLPIPPHQHTGWRWIRTTEAICSRFTVCPLWPLGNPPIIRSFFRFSQYRNIAYHYLKSKKFLSPSSRFEGFPSSALCGFSQCSTMAEVAGSVNLIFPPVTG